MRAVVDAVLVELEERLYGVVGAEILHFDPAAVYESDIEPWLDEHDHRPREIEEWSVHPPDYHVPSAETIVERICEMIADNGEIDEYGSEQWDKSIADSDVLGAAEALRTVMASKITYRMADKHLRSHIVTWNLAGEPLLDGEAMYAQRADSDAGEPDAQTDPASRPLRPD